MFIITLWILYKSRNCCCSASGGEISSAHTTLSRKIQIPVVYKRVCCIITGAWLWFRIQENCKRWERSSRLTNTRPFRTNPSFLIQYSFYIIRVVGRQDHMLDTGVCYKWEHSFNNYILEFLIIYYKFMKVLEHVYLEHDLIKIWVKITYSNKILFY